MEPTRSVQGQPAGALVAPAPGHAWLATLLPVQTGTVLGAEEA